MQSTQIPRGLDTKWKKFSLNCSDKSQRSEVEGEETISYFGKLCIDILPQAEIVELCKIITENEADIVILSMLYAKHFKSELIINFLKPIIETHSIVIIHDSLDKYRWKGQELEDFFEKSPNIFCAEDTLFTFPTLKLFFASNSCPVNDSYAANIPRFIYSGNTKIKVCYVSPNKPTFPKCITPFMVFGSASSPYINNKSISNPVSDILNNETATLNKDFYKKLMISLSGEIRRNE